MRPALWILELPASPERILAALGVTGPVDGGSGNPPPSPEAVREAVEEPIDAGTDPRPDARTDPQVLRGPRDPGEPA